ncbi:MAG: tetratricopeptide repeat protein [Gemmatimonadetes bacterium]|nr:tetratricopeptide repeat protein [Gemmatimonadota bacterium]
MAGVLRGRMAPTRRWAATVAWPIVGLAVGLAVRPAVAQQQIAVTADSLWRRGDFAAAGRLYEQRLNADPHDVVAQHRLAILAMRGRRWNDAFAILDRLLEQEPAHAEARVSLAHTHAGVGQIDRSIAIADSILELNPRDVGALQARGQFAARSGRMVEAEQFWRRAFDLDPANSDSRLGLARTLRQQGRHAAAWDILEPALQAPYEDILDEAAWIARATRPRTGLTFILEDDTDGNTIGSLILLGGTRLAPRVDVRADAYVRSASFESGAAFDHTARGLNLTLWTQREPGWAFSITAGAATSSAPATGTTPAWGASITSPGRNRLAATLAVAHTAFDYTAVLMRSAVTIGEGSADARWVPARDWTITATVSAATLESDVSGDANRRWRINGEVVRAIPVSPFSVALGWRSFGYRDDRNDGYFDPDFYGVAELAGKAHHEGRHWTLEAEIVPGLQRIGRHGESSGSLRATGAAAYLFRPGRQLRVSAAYANSGLQQLSPGSGSGYGYTSISIGMAWWF